MTEREILETDLETHKKSLKRLQDPNFRNKTWQGRHKHIYCPMNDLNPLVVIPSYEKIIKSIEDELAATAPKGKKTAKKKGK